MLFSSLDDFKTGFCQQRDQSASKPANFWKSPAQTYFAEMAL
jgi:hypothetical protein